MRFKHSKPLAAAIKKPKNKKEKDHLSEVTCTIERTDGVNFHDTVMIDLSKTSQVEYDGRKYELKVENAYNYLPSFLDFDKKLSFFFDRHKTMARFLDWFNYRERASVAVGFLFQESDGDASTPTAAVNLEREDLNEDFAALNYKITKNMAVEGHYKEVSNKLKGKNDLGGLAWIGLIIVIVIAVVVVVSLVTGSGGGSEAVQNVTAPIASITPYLTPAPTVIIIG